MGSCLTDYDPNWVTKFVPVTCRRPSTAQFWVNDRDVRQQKLQQVSRASEIS